MSLTYWNVISVRTIGLVLMAGIFFLQAQVLNKLEKPVLVTKPNIINIILDEWGYYELSMLGHPHLKTPRIDQLAKEGIFFSQALAGGQECAPTRNVLMTGQHQGHTTILGNNPSNTIRAGDVTAAEILKKGGYVTGGFGKWGLGSEGSPGVPEKHGFDEFYGYYNQVHAHTYFPGYLVRNGVRETLPGNERTKGEPGNAYGNYYQGGTYSHDMIFAESKKWLQANKDTTFFLYLPWTLPHGVLGIPEDNPFWLKYKDKPWTAGAERPEDTRVYAAMVEMFDAQIGEIIDSLKSWGIDRNTFVYVSGDNGSPVNYQTDKITGEKKWPDGFFSPNVNPKTGVRFKGKKGGFYEGGLRVPGIAWWPGKIAPEQVSDHLCSFADLLPTWVEIAGLSLPANIDGISMLPTLVGEKLAGHAQVKHEYLYWRDDVGFEAVRMQDWKLIIKPSGDEELYDLGKDISESKNVAAANPDVVKKMQGYATEAKKAY